MNNICVYSLRGIIDFVVTRDVTYVPTDAYEGAFAVTSSDGAIEYIANGAYSRVCKRRPCSCSRYVSLFLSHTVFDSIPDALKPFEPFDTCAGSGGGAMVMSASATVTVAKSFFLGCSTTNANGGSMAVISDTPLVADQTVLAVTDTVFGKSTTSHYGAINFASLSKASFTNIEIRAEDEDVESLSGIFFVSGGLMTCASTCPAGTYGNCTAADECFSCLLDKCTACPVSAVPSLWPYYPTDHSSVLMTSQSKRCFAFSL